MIQNPSVAGSGSGGVNVEVVPVEFSTSVAHSSVQIIYTTVVDGGVLFNDETKYGGGGTIYALKGSALYCTANSSYSIVLNISSGGVLVSSGTYKGLYAQDYDFKIYQVTG